MYTHQVHLSTEKQSYMVRSNRNRSSLWCRTCDRSLMADGVTEIHDIYHIDRGYDNLDGKLAHLGAKMWREEVED